MLYFALIFLGYFLGVMTALYIFPPNTKEILEQEKDALRPIIEAKKEEYVSGPDLAYPGNSFAS